MPRDNPQRGEMPPHRQDEAARERDAARQQEAQDEERPRTSRRLDEQGRDKGRSGSESNR